MVSISKARAITERLDKELLHVKAESDREPKDAARNREEKEIRIVEQSGILDVLTPKHIRVLESIVTRSPAGSLLLTEFSGGLYAPDMMPNEVERCVSDLLDAGLITMKERGDAVNPDVSITHKGRLAVAAAARLEAYKRLTRVVGTFASNRSQPH